MLRLVARFKDEKVACEAAADLVAFFREHAEQVPCVATQGGVLIIYDDFCSDFPPGLEMFLTARGADGIEPTSPLDPCVSVVFRVPNAGAAVRAELTALFSRKIQNGRVTGFKPPWAEHCTEGDASFFSAGDTLGYYVPIHPADLTSLKRWLDEQGAEDSSIRLCEDEDHARFAAIAEARCTACEGALTYLDPRVHGVECAQLACSACGATFDLASFEKPASLDYRRAASAWTVALGCIREEEDALALCWLVDSRPESLLANNHAIEVFMNAARSERGIADAMATLMNQRDGGSRTYMHFYHVTRRHEPSDGAILAFVQRCADAGVELSYEDGRSVRQVLTESGWR